ncbi:hypothetical protein C0993_003486 [Termitomyces sp. T159_Od127]|nr:hypothetical protein C0993_003486 [Termitomyces sp. T159_Od127]
MGFPTDILSPHRLVQQPYIASWFPSQTSLPSDDLNKVVSHDAETQTLRLEATILEPTLPPVNRLPDELLSAIFSFEPDVLLSSGDVFQKRSLPRRTLVCGKKIDPILLGQVCKQWRNVTLTTPLLWTSFFVLCNLKTQTVELLKIWLERSADLPLNIKFLESLCDLKIDEDLSNPPKNPVTPQIMELLTTHAHRWKTIDFEFSLQISPLLLNLPQDSFKILESVKLRSRRATNVRFDGLPPLIKAWDLFHVSPSFHIAEYEMEYVHDRLRDIPWSRLTSVDVTISMDELFQILPECKNLVELRYTDPLARYVIYDLPQKEEPPESLINIVLPSLRHLSMTVSSPPDEALQNLTLPMLESVYIRQNNIWIKQPDPQAFTDLLMRSHCTLKQFSYHALGGPAAEEVLTELLGSPSMSFVGDLVVDVQVTDKFADWLMTGLGQTALPRLETFTLVRSSMEPGTLSKMITSLKEGHEAFRFFSAQYWNLYEEDKTRFSDLREEGLVIKD